MRDRAPPVPIRQRLRIANAGGFALTFFFAIWLFVFLVSLLKVGFEDARLPLPFAFVAVGLLSLAATLVLFAVVFLRFAWRGADLGAWKPRLYLFWWSCAGGVFFLSQALAMLRYGAGNFPHIPTGLSELYWNLSVVGAVLFPLLMWVNAEPGHRLESEDGEAWDEEEDAYEEEVYEEAADA